MIGSLGGLVWGAGLGFVPYNLMAICSLRFAAPMRRDAAPVTFWRLLGVSYVNDIGIIALLFLFIVPMSDRGPWTTVAGWLGAGGAGLAWVAFLDLVAARKETAEMRDYYRSVLIMVALAIVAMTGIGCAFIPFAHRWISNLAGASFVFVTLCACIYRKPAPKAVPGLP